MQPNFFLKAEKKFNKDSNAKPEYRVKEHYQMVGGGLRINASGIPAPVIDLSGHVDVDIEAQYPAEVAAFRAYVSKNDTKLYDECKKNPDVMLNVSERMTLDPAKEVAENLSKSAPTGAKSANKAAKEAAEN